MAFAFLYKMEIEIFPDELSKNSIPVTTKSDKKNHGYGIKSIRYSAEKYGGYVNISNVNNWFRVEMIFPKVGGDVSG